MIVVFQVLAVALECIAKIAADTVELSHVSLYLLDVLIQRFVIAKRKPSKYLR